MYGLGNALFELKRDEFLPQIEELLDKAGVKREGLVTFTMEQVETDKGNINHSNIYKLMLGVTHETMLPVVDKGAWKCVKRMEYATVLYFYLSTMPGCCGVLISNGTFVNSEFRNKGLATLMQQFKEQLAYAAGYTVLLGTDITISKNTSVLDKTGWKVKDSFENRRTHRVVNILVKELKPIEPK